jgi:DNA-binding transcriptional MocR family regulator
MVFKVRMPDRRDDKETSLSKTQLVFAKIEGRITSGALKTGAKLPSIRQAAEQFAVSKNTIVEAYDRLAAIGLVTSRPGSGFQVHRRTAQAIGARPRHVAEAIDIASLLTAQLEESFAIRVGDGRPPASWMEESEVRRHLGHRGRYRQGNESGYGSALGLLGLRECLAHRLAEREILAAPDQILLTFGANHALDLIARRFVAPGDTVLVDDPGYYPLFAKLKLAQARIVGVKRLATGPDPDDLASKAANEQAKLFFTQSLAHNPTGGSINLPTAHAVLSIAVRHGLMVVEDDPFVDLPTVGSVRMTTLDQLNNLISVGTFSKTLSASLRCGFIAARSDIIASLAELKMLTTVNSSGHVEQLVYDLINDGHYFRHLKRLGNRIRNATDKVVANFDKRGFNRFAEPSGGYYVYVTLPKGIDDIQLAKDAGREGIFIAPGSVFNVEKKVGLACIRVNIARADDKRFYEFLSRYADQHRIE